MDSGTSRGLKTSALLLLPLLVLCFLFTTSSVSAQSSSSSSSSSSSTATPPISESDVSEELQRRAFETRGFTATTRSVPRGSGGAETAMRIVSDTSALYSDSYTCFTGVSSVPSRPSYSNYPCSSYPDDEFTSAHREYLVNEVLPPVFEWLNSLFLIESPSEWASIDPALDCGVDYPLALDSNLNTRTDLETFIVVTARPTRYYSSVITGWSYACQTDSLGRPMIGHLNLNPGDFWPPDTTDPPTAVRTTRQHIADVAHHMFHLLGFSPTQWSTFPSGSPFTEVTGAIGSSGINRNVTYLTGSTLTEAAQNYFDCSDLPGMELENRYQAYDSGAHWERRVAFSDFMAYTVGVSPTYSNISLAAMHDLPFYSINWTALEVQDGDLDAIRQGSTSPRHAPPASWGRGLGCSWVLGRCQEWEEPLYSPCTPEEADNYERSCAGDRNSKAYCGLFDFACDESASGTFCSDPWYQPSDGSYLGGTSLEADYCPFPKPWSISSCDIPSNAFDDSADWYYGYEPYFHAEEYGPGARCFDSDLVSVDGRSQSGEYRWKGSCHVMECVSETAYKILLDGLWYDCPSQDTLLDRVLAFDSEVNNTNLIASKTWTGSVACADPAVMCGQGALYDATRWPEFDRVEPSHAPSGGAGVTLTVWGGGFIDGDTQVYMDREECLVQEVYNSTTLSCTAPFMTGIWGTSSAHVTVRHVSTGRNAIGLLAYSVWPSELAPYVYGMAGAFSFMFALMPDLLWQEIVFQAGQYPTEAEIKAMAKEADKKKAARKAARARIVAGWMKHLGITKPGLENARSTVAIRSAVSTAFLNIGVDTDAPTIGRFDTKPSFQILTSVGSSSIPPAESALALGAPPVGITPISSLGSFASSYGGSVGQLIRDKNGTTGSTMTLKPPDAQYLHPSNSSKSVVSQEDLNSVASIFSATVLAEAMTGDDDAVAPTPAAPAPIRSSVQLQQDEAVDHAGSPKVVPQEDCHVDEHEDEDDFDPDEQAIGHIFVIQSEGSDSEESLDADVEVPAAIIIEPEAQNSAPNPESPPSSSHPIAGESNVAEEDVSVEFDLESDLEAED